MWLNLSSLSMEECFLSILSKLQNTFPDIEESWELENAAEAIIDQLEDKIHYQCLLWLKEAILAIARNLDTPTKHIDNSAQLFEEMVISFIPGNYGPPISLFLVNTLLSLLPLSSLLCNRDLTGSEVWLANDGVHLLTFFLSFVYIHTPILIFQKISFQGLPLKFFLSLNSFNVLDTKLYQGRELNKTFCRLFFHFTDGERCMKVFFKFQWTPIICSFCCLSTLRNYCQIQRHRDLLSQFLMTSQIELLCL